ncbi:putative ribonuclease H-like domain-containing protein [Tanacetum coccineum]
MALMAFSDSEVLNNKTCSNTCLKSYETLKTQYDNLRIEFNKSEFDLATYKRGLAAVEEQLVFYKKNEVMFCDQIDVLKRDASFKDSEINALNIQIEKLKKEKESNQIKIDNFENASKSLDKLIGCQISDNNRKGFQQPEFKGYGVKVNKSVGENSSNEIKKTPDAPIIEKWVSDSDEDESEVMVSKKVQHKPEQANQPRKMVQKPVVNNVKKGNGQREVRPVWNNDMRTNHQNFSNSRRNFPPTTVLTKSGIVPISTARQSSSRAAAPVSVAMPINTVAPKPFVNVAKPKPNAFQKSHSLSRRPFNQQAALKNRILNNKVNTAKVNSVNIAKGKSVTSVVGEQGINAVKSSACWGDLHVALKDTGIFDSGCSRHMTGNKSYLTYYQDYDGGFVAFAGSSKGGKITGKGKIRTGNLDFEDVYFVKELKFNLFSVSQMCDKKNSVLFTETECLILSPDFKLPDESQVMLKIPRKDNMYSFDLNNIVPSKGLTCLFAKATNDESKLWHRRLGYINFKTMNKLVKGNLVRGLPSKIFENDHTCVACQKGKQHKATCKSKLVNTISQPLQILHMDLFGLTFVKSIMGKMYSLVVTDDYSRFSWVFFLGKKDETSGILKDFTTRIENQLNYKVKIIRCDNETEFKNYEMNQFCRIKAIKREFSNARTPQQNGVAKRKIRTLIEAARTMLADSLLRIPFWAEAVNTDCYVQNRVLVTKPHNKIPYELLIGRTPIISFMRPFGCPVTILSTLDHLGKFDGKANEGFLVAGKEKVPDQEYILLPLLHTSSNVFSSSGEAESSPKDDAIKKNGVKDPAKEGDMNGPREATHTNSTNRLNTVSSPVNIDDNNAYRVFTPVNAATPSNDDYPIDPLMSDLEDTANLQDTGIFRNTYDDEDVGAEADINNLETTISFKLLNVWTLVDLPHGKKAIGTKWVFKNKKDQRGIVVRNKARLVAQGYRQEEGVDYDEVFAPVARIEAIRLFLAYASYMDFTVYQMDVKSAFLYGTIEEEKALYGLHQTPRTWYETLSTYLLENRFRRGTIDKTLFIKKIKNDILLVQVTPMETHKPLSKDADGIDVDVHLYRSMIGSLMYLTSSRPDIIYLKGQPTLGLWYPKDSLMDLIAYSDSNYAGASLDRKSITKGCQFLGYRLISWQCKKQIIVANSTTEAEYIAASNCCGQVLWLQNQLLDYGYNFMQTKIYVDNESAICVVKNPVYHSKTKHIEIRHHFIRDSYKKKLIEMVKIHTDYNVADLLTKAFDVTRNRGLYTSEIANMDFCDKHNMVAFLQKPTGSEEFHHIVDFLVVNDGEQHITVTVDGHTITITEASVRRHLQLADVDCISTLPNTKNCEQLTLMGYVSTDDKLTFQKGKFSPQWRFLIHTILHCLSPKKTSWEQFSSNIATAIICLATNRTFKFSKLIFDGMVKNVDSKTKFLMYPRFILMLLDKKKMLLKQHKKTYVAPSLTKKLFSNMKRGFSRERIPLFDSMLYHDQPGQGERPTLTVESQHTPIASPTTSQPTTSQPMSSQEPTTEPIPTTSSPPLHETTIPQTTSSMPHDLPLLGGDTLGSDEGSTKLNELTDLCTKLFDKVTSLENDLK